jgi:hypothetical protein
VKTCSKAVCAVPPSCPARLRKVCCIRRCRGAAKSCECRSSVADCPPPIRPSSKNGWMPALSGPKHFRSQPVNGGRCESRSVPRFPPARPTHRSILKMEAARSFRTLRDPEHRHRRKLLIISVRPHNNRFRSSPPSRPRVAASSHGISSPFRVQPEPGPEADVEIFSAG